MSGLVSTPSTNTPVPSTATPCATGLATRPAIKAVSIILSVGAVAISPATLPSSPFLSANLAANFAAAGAPDRTASSAARPAKPPKAPSPSPVFLMAVIAALRPFSLSRIFGNTSPANRINALILYVLRWRQGKAYWLYLDLFLQPWHSRADLKDFQEHLDRYYLRDQSN